MSFFLKNKGDTKLRITIEKAFNLAVADENGASDPYAELYIDGKKVGKTSVEKATLNPVWNFHTNIPFDLDKPYDLIEVYVWDKDRLKDAKMKDILLFKKTAIQDDFLGKISIQLKSLFQLVHSSGKVLEYDSPENREVVLNLEKRNIDDNVSGDIQIKLGTIKLNA